jgi:hypothetical protein
MGCGVDECGVIVMGMLLVVDDLHVARGIEIGKDAARMFRCLRNIRCCSMNG